MTSRRTDAQRVALVRQRVNDANDALMARHPWLLRHQDMIGLLIQLGAVAGMIASATLYLQGHQPAWLTIMLVAFCASITHEMEHDLIHHLFFKKQPFIQDLLMGLGWLARPSTASPWHRRKLHFHHHRYSGDRSDLEERAITNGEPWGFKRLLMTADMRLSILMRLPMLRQASIRYIKVTQPAGQPRSRLANMLSKAGAGFPLATSFWTLWHLFLVLHGGALLGLGWAQSGTARHILAWLDPLTVCLIAPNVLRTFCLHFMSSNMHYFGDVEVNNPMQQVQVLDHPVFWPLQLFCFNFGATHAIHHFVVGQTFYARQWTMAEAHAALREAGIPFNDFGTFTRANRRLAWDGVHDAVQQAGVQAS